MFSRIIDWIKDQKRVLAIALSAVMLLAVILMVGSLVTGGGINVFARERIIPIYRVNRDDKKIAISFDAAWGSEKTVGILDILDKYQIKTTFFLVGFWVDRYPERTQLISQRGHEIGNHSTNHPNMPKLSAEQMENEIMTTHNKIKELTGQEPKIFRPPYGDYDNQVMTVLHNLGYEGVQWDVDSLDWKEEGTDAMVKRVTGNVRSGSIVLFHNNSRDILEALPLILDELLSQGYTIVPVSELLLDEPYIVDSQGIQQPVK
ncbi:MAG: polysaccharide deacetylase family protein [Christensenellales bacterium]|jgi:polysaccharide deacetylase family sporulation protein PdaB